jgi:hypothetical protein
MAHLGKLMKDKRYIGILVKQDLIRTTLTAKDSKLPF